MPEQTPAPKPTAESLLKDLQLLLNLAHQAPVPLAVHQEADKRAQNLFSVLFVPAPAAKQADPAEAVAQATGIAPQTPKDNADLGSASKPEASADDKGEPGPGV